jgi:hypothetical protein
MKIEIKELSLPERLMARRTRLNLTAHLHLNSMLLKL